MGGVFHAAASRGAAQYGALTSRRSFSFGDFHDPQRMGFGALRVLNEEMLAPGAGVPLHAHENMEILSLPLAGSLRHQDSRGGSHVIAPGEIHLLSAGVGITHWEFNHSTQASAHYLQLWIHPRVRRTPTHYAHGRIDPALTENAFALLAAPAHGIVELKQDAWVSLARCAPGLALQYTRYAQSNGLYLFVIEGCLQAGAQRLARGDGLGLTDDVPALHAVESATLLALEVPLANYLI